MENMKMRPVHMYSVNVEQVFFIQANRTIEQSFDLLVEG